MTLWILDTDHISLFQKRHPGVTERLTTLNPNDVYVTIVSIEEQLRGRLNQIRRGTTEDALTFGYSGLQEALHFFNQVKVLRFDRTAYSCYADLMQQRLRIGTRDLRIAAIALSVNGTVVTRNQRDFSQVPGLSLADWTV